MSTEEEDLTIDPAFQPSADDVSYDLQRALSSVVALRSQISEDALTASMLGTERAGHGVVIGEKGLVLTVGYLVTEAESIWLVDINGLAVPGHAMGYDQETGLGLVQALGQLNVPAIPLFWQGMAARRMRPRQKSSRSGNSPATGNMSSTRASSRRRRTPHGAGPP